MNELWRTRRWKDLLAYIDGLPLASRFKEALLNEPDVGRAIVASGQQDDDGDYHPPLSSWSSEVSLLTDIKDGIQAAVRAIIVTNGGKAGSFTPSPRPRTAVDAAKDERAGRIRDRILGLFAPHELEK